MTWMDRPFRLPILIVASATLLAGPAAGFVYFIEAGDKEVWRADLDGTDRTLLFHFELGRGQHLDVDADAGHLYWCDPAEDVIQRSRLDGTEPEVLVEIVNPYGIAIDEPRGKMYWTEQSGDGLYRANLDGTGVEKLRSDGLEPQGIAVNSVSQRIYWVDSMIDALLAADLDGTNVDTLVTDLDDPFDVAVHPTQGWVFWTDSGTDRIGRVDADGENLLLLEQAGDGVPSMFNLRGIDVDPVRDLVFVTGDLISGHMYRMDVDGGNKELVIDDENYGPWGVAADPTTGYFYWWHADRLFYRTDPLVGGKEVAVAGMTSPAEMALDPTEGRLFWADDRHLFSLRTDGTDFQRLASGDDGDFEGRIEAVDHAASTDQLYWVTSLGLYRSETDGSSIVELVPGCDLQNPNDLVVDEVRGHLYTTRTSGVLQRVNLDGSNCTDLALTGLVNPHALALDAAGGILYIADHGPDTIFRYDIVGDAITPIVEAEWNVLGMSIEGPHLYWTGGAILLRRADRTDGSGVITIFDDLSSPWGIATDGGATPTRTMTWSELKSRF